MKNFIVDSGDFITTSGICRMNDHPGREITLIHGDAVPTFQGRKVKFDSSALQRTPGEDKAEWKGLYFQVQRSINRRSP